MGGGSRKVDGTEEWREGWRVTKEGSQGERVKDINEGSGSSTRHLRRSRYMLAG